MADHQNGTGVALEVVFQPLHGGEVQMVGGLVQNKDVRLLEEELGQTETGQLTAGEDPTFLLQVSCAKPMPDSTFLMLTSML